jgi:hypothetical protein
MPEDADYGDVLSSAAGDAGSVLSQSQATVSESLRAYPTEMKDLEQAYGTAKERYQKATDVTSGIQSPALVTPQTPTLGVDYKEGKWFDIATLLAMIGASAVGARMRPALIAAIGARNMYYQGKNAEAQQKQFVYSMQMKQALEINKQAIDTYKSVLNAANKNANEKLQEIKIVAQRMRDRAMILAAEQRGLQGAAAHVGTLSRAQGYLDNTQSQIETRREKLLLDRLKAQGHGELTASERLKARNADTQLQYLSWASQEIGIDLLGSFTAGNTEPPPEWDDKKKALWGEALEVYRQFKKNPFFTDVMTSARDAGDMGSMFGKPSPGRASDDRDRQEFANKLKALGWPDDLVSVAYGVSTQEGGASSVGDGGTSFGLLQLHDDPSKGVYRRTKFFNWARDNKLDPHSGETQAVYLDYEMKHDFPQVWNALMRAGSMEEKNRIWVDQFQRPRTPYYAESLAAARRHRGYQALPIAGKKKEEVKGEQERKTAEEKEIIKAAAPTTQDKQVYANRQRLFASIDGLRELLKSDPSFVVGKAGVIGSTIGGLVGKVAPTTIGEKGQEFQQKITEVAQRLRDYLRTRSQMGETKTVDERVNALLPGYKGWTPTNPKKIISALDELERWAKSEEETDNPMLRKAYGKGESTPEPSKEDVRAALVDISGRLKRGEITQDQAIEEAAKYAALAKKYGLR